jgi:hypothetical protein
MLDRTFRMLVIVVCLAVIWTAFSPNAAAQRFDKGTRITMNTPFQVPGKTLPAGEYVIRLMEIPGKPLVLRQSASSCRRLSTSALAHRPSPIWNRDRKFQNSNIHLRACSNTDRPRWFDSCRGDDPFRGEASMPGENRSANRVGCGAHSACRSSHSLGFAGDFR